MESQSQTPTPKQEEFKSGFVTLVGRPNAGKSTLINAVIGKKIAITSDTAQTTRHRFRAVLTRPEFQLIMVDTPGLHKPHDALGEELNTSALKALEDVDVVAMLIDASQPIG
ncbi:MAG: GTPase, partial [Raoultibacter sp.]